MKYPIQIIEFPHQGRPREWFLYDEAHLSEVIAADSGRGYDEWCSDKGMVEWVENEDGNFDAVNDKRGDLATYLEWLGHDLKTLHVTDADGRNLDIGLVSSATPEIPADMHPADFGSELDLSNPTDRMIARAVKNTGPKR